MITRGSEWHRWEPHIHGPGTVFNNQFGGTDAWDRYFAALEACSPAIEALAVTDYYVTDTYEEVLKYREAGKLPNLNFVFPNIELRLDIAAKQGFVNVHLLVNPDVPNHVDEIKRFLSRLHFHAYGDRFDCTKSDLIRLGRTAEPSLSDDRAALVHGATQFKVNFNSLREALEQNAWANANILVAIAGGQTDGTSGVRQAADQTIRQELEKFADIIFASSAAQREFWLGQKRLTAEQLRQRYGGCKPCMHGSDAHDLASIGQPVDQRYTWIKGALSFDALRQACIDPEGRAYVGAQPPKGAMPSQVITHVTVNAAPWLGTTEIPLNSGLVACGGQVISDTTIGSCAAIFRS